MLPPSFIYSTCELTIDSSLSTFDHFANQNVSGMHTINIVCIPDMLYTNILYAKLTGMHTPGPDGEYAGGSGDHEYLFFGQ